MISSIANPLRGPLVHLKQSLLYFPCLHSPNGLAPGSLSFSLLSQHSSPGLFCSSPGLSWDFSNTRSTFLPQGISAVPSLECSSLSISQPLLCASFRSLLKHTPQRGSPDTPTEATRLPLLYPAIP